LFAAARLGLALATIRFGAFRAAFDTLRALERDVAAFSFVLLIASCA
jgi:hypothetical protein